MTLRRSCVLVLCSLFALAAPVFAQQRLGKPDYVTPNFAVYAPTKQLAKTFGEYAEKYRTEKAKEWLGQEMPQWKDRCPLEVQVIVGRTGGATTFTYDMNVLGVQSQEMTIFGEVPQLLNSVLPHEITHTVFAYHFGQAVPRWADEGGSVLSENDKERLEHDIKCREFLNEGRGIPLKYLFAMKNYPRDTIVLYAQGYSVSDYLIRQGGGGIKGRKKFLDFVGTGLQSDNRNWEKAVRTHYGLESVDDLQEQWLAALKKPPVNLAARNTPRPAELASNTPSTEIRTSAMPSLPMLEPPVVARGAMPMSNYEAPLRASPLPAPVWNSQSPQPPRNLQNLPTPLLLPPEIPSK